MSQAQSLLGLRRPGRGLGHGGRAIVRGAAGWVRYRAGHHLVSRTLGLGELRGRDLLGAAQVGVVRIVLIPAAELPRLQANTGKAFTPPGLSIAVEHAVADGPSHGDLAGQTLATGFTPERARQDVPVFIGSGHAFLQAKINPHRAGVRPIGM